MMTVLEYANDVNKNIDFIFDLCKKLDIEVSSSDDELTEEEIILLDNEIENTESVDNNNKEDAEDFDEQDFEDSYEEELTEVNVVATVKKKIKKC